MSQFDLAVLLLFLGIAVGWRLTVFGMLPVAILVAVGVGVYCHAAGDGAVIIALHIVEGLVMFEAAYLLGALLADARQRARRGEGARMLDALMRDRP